MLFILQSGGELQNEEKLADRLMRLVQNVVKISVAGEKPSNLKRVSGQVSTCLMDLNFQRI